jgi:hypothetical protein
VGFNSAFKGLIIIKIIGIFIVLVFGSRVLKMMGPRGVKKQGGLKYGGMIIILTLFVPL